MTPTRFIENTVDTYRRNEMIDEDEGHLPENMEVLPPSASLDELIKGIRNVADSTGYFVRGVKVEGYYIDGFDSSVSLTIITKRCAGDLNLLENTVPEMSPAR
jgi:hypothetical protein